MNNTLHIPVLPKHPLEPLLIRNIHLVKFRPFPADALDAIEDFYRGVFEVVDDDDFVVCFEEGESGEGADVAGTSVMYREKLAMAISGWVVMI